MSETPGVAAAAPFVYSDMMIRFNNRATAIVMKGIDPEKTGAVTDVASNIVKGPVGKVHNATEKQEILTNIRNPARSVFQAPDDNKEYPGIVIGDELAKFLWAGVGDKVHIVNPVSTNIGPMGLPTPAIKSFRVAGIFYSGMYEYDTKWTYVGIEDAQQFLGIPNQITGIEGRVDDIDNAGDIAISVEQKLGYPYMVRHWKELNKNLFAALKLEKIVMGLILSLIVMVASLNIIGTLILVVLTRGRGISILRAIGSSSQQICLIFMLEGLIIGLVGTVLGTVLGLCGCWALDRYQFPLNTDVYYLDTLPVVIEPMTVAFVSLSAIVISFLATIYPAMIAAKMNPVEGLRYE